MFTDLQTGCPRGNPVELTAHLHWCFGLHVNSIVVRQTAREKDKYDGFCFGSGAPANARKAVNWEVLNPQPIAPAWIAVRRLTVCLS